MFILDGPNYSGKTTLAARVLDRLRRERWARRFDWPREYVSAYRPLRPEGWTDYLAEYRLAVGRHAVADRLGLSGLVEETLAQGRPHPSFDSHARRLLARALNARGAVQVALFADRPTVELRLNARPGDVVRYWADYERRADAYRRALGSDLALGREGLQTYVLDTSTVTDPPRQRAALERDLGEVLAVWRLRRDRAESVAAFAPLGWGSLWPRVVFVGERYNGPKAPAYRYPFSNGQDASRTLSELLDAAGIGEGAAYYLNAYGPRASDRLDPSALRWLAPRAVVALGREAARYLREVGVEHREFPHPQYLGRFERSALPRWGARLRELLKDAL